MLGDVEEISFEWMGDNYRLTTLATARQRRRARGKRVGRDSAAWILTAAARDPRVARALDSFRTRFDKTGPRLFGVSAVSSLADLVDETMGPLVLFRQQRPSVELDSLLPIESTEPPPPPQEEPLSWIQIEIVDEDGEPVPSIEVKVTTPDKDTQTMKTSREGVIFLHGVAEGSCDVELVGVDESAVSPG